MTLMPYLRLMRPANIITALADILAGFAVIYNHHYGSFSSRTPGETIYYLDANGIPNSELDVKTLIPKLLWLLLSTIGLYGGGCRDE